MNQELAERTIGEIVAEDYRAAGAFKKFGLDFCCGGKRTVAEACNKKGVNVKELQQELRTALGRASGDADYASWPADLLVEYIVSMHHRFVREKLPEIEAYARKVAKVHGRSYPALNDMLEIFLQLRDEMTDHLDKEELLLFPYIKQLVEADAKGRTPESTLEGGTPRQAVAMLESEHEEAGRLMAELEEISGGFIPPEDACPTFRVYFHNLEGFRDDLHKHVHLENNILFPRALELHERLSR
ncbi:MAG: iron-sulfur cluster repair di-iron protein [Balneolaceae bacterium]|nr:iron-sulfur cluster repair di-iron protein [Balneolaceae bacterium]